MLRSGKCRAATSENFWRMPSSKSEDLRSKPQDFFTTQLSLQPEGNFHGSSPYFFISKILYFFSFFF